LRVTDDFLRAYFLRPELHPVEESCAAEHALHSALMDDPRRRVAASEIEAVTDEDARENYRLLLRFRERLLEAGTIEGCYATLFRGGDVDVPPLFIDQLVHVILRNVLADRGDPLEARCAELFFREQKLTLRDGHALLADLETIGMHASGSRYGSIGRLIVEAEGSVGRVNLDVLDRNNASLYWQRESRHDTAISLGYGHGAPEALGRVIEAWIAHFQAVAVSVHPIRAIEEEHWAWHIGLDAESTAILNDLWRGEDLDAGRMRRILALFRLDFADDDAVRAEVAGHPVYLAIAANDSDVVRVKPQNLLINLPLAVQS
jgi:hypothetical protein